MKTMSAILPARPRIVQVTAGQSLLIVLPLPPGLHAQQQFSPSTSHVIATTLPQHDRAFWQKFSRSPVLLKISTILRGLGLRQLNSGPGKIVFQHDTLDDLAGAVADAVKRLPQSMEELLNVATDYAYEPLQEEIAGLLHRFGEGIWGARSERTWLLGASEDFEEYKKDLVFEDNADQVV